MPHAITTAEVVPGPHFTNALAVKAELPVGSAESNELPADGIVERKLPVASDNAAEAIPNTFRVKEIPADALTMVNAATPSVCDPERYMTGASNGPIPNEVFGKQLLDCDTNFAPAGHAAHDADPKLYVNAAQRVHEPEFTTGENVPSGQGTQPNALKRNPAGQVHMSEPPEPVATVLDMHVHVDGVAAAAPAVEFEFAGQGRHAPTKALKKRPAEQAEHEEAPGAHDHVP